MTRFLASLTVPTLLALAATLPFLSEAHAQEKQPDGDPTLLAELKEHQAQLHVLQGERPLILPTVDQQAVAAVVESWTGIPVGRMVKNEVESILKLADTLEQRIIGQRHALDMIARRLGDWKKPKPVPQTSIRQTIPTVPG